MTPVTGLAITFFGSIMIGVPIYIALGISSVIAMFLGANIPLVWIAQVIYSGMNNFVIIAIPLFVLAGTVMEKGGITGEIIDVFNICIGRVRGGLGIVTIMSCMFFAAISGSGPGTVAAVGSIMIPAMLKAKYSKGYASAVASSGGTLGIMIPPSNPMIVYAALSQISVTGLFIAGVIPGIFIGISLILLAYIFARIDKVEVSHDKFSWKKLLNALVKGKWSLFTPFLILGGIYSGIFTPVEAATVAVVYALFVSVVINKKFKLKDIKNCLTTSNLISGTIMIIIGTSTLFGRILTMYNVPQSIVKFMSSISTDANVILLIIVGLFLILGMIMETLSTIIILTPMLLPVVTALGVDPVVFGIIFVATNEIAFLTPPLGINLFVASKLTNCSVETISKSVFPYVLVLIVDIVIFIFFPQIILFLPRLLGY